MGAYYRMDTLLLHRLLPDGKEQAGIFAHAFRLLDFMSNYALLFPVLLLPLFSRALQQKEPVGDLLRLAVLLLFVPSLAVVLPSRITSYNVCYTKLLRITGSPLRVPSFTCWQLRAGVALVAGLSYNFV